MPRVEITFGKPFTLSRTVKTFGGFPSLAISLARIASCTVLRKPGYTATWVGRATSNACVISFAVDAVFSGLDTHTRSASGRRGGQASLRYHSTRPPCRMTQEDKVRLVPLSASEPPPARPVMRGPLTELGHSKERTSPSFKPSWCRRPHAPAAASVRSPPYVRDLPAMVSTCTSLSAEMLSGLYLVMNCGIERWSSTDSGPYLATRTLGDDMLEAASRECATGWERRGTARGSTEGGLRTRGGSEVSF